MIGSCGVLCRPFLKSVFVIENMFYNRIAILAEFVKQIGDILRLKNQGVVFFSRKVAAAAKVAKEIRLFVMSTRQPPANLSRAC